MAQQPLATNTFLGMLSVIWGFTLFMCYRQAELCERRSAQSPEKCSVEWQLAITAGMGMGQSVLGLFTAPPTTQPRRKPRVGSAAAPNDEEP